MSSLLHRSVRSLFTALAVIGTGLPAHAALVSHLSGSTYDVDVTSPSDLLAIDSFAGGSLSTYSTAAALAGSGVILEALAGQFPTSTQYLRVTFTAHPGYEFSSVRIDHVYSWFHDKGGHTVQTDWVLTPSAGAPTTGGAGQDVNDNWGGAFSGAQQTSGTLNVNARSFVLEVKLFYYLRGFPGGCSGPNGLCASISQPSVNLTAQTRTVAAPEPAVPALLTSALLIGRLVSRRRG